MPEPTQVLIDNIMGEIHALNSKIQVIAQRMKIMERNEEIIGKTLISHNKMLKGIEEEINALKSGGVLPESGSGDIEKNSVAIKEVKDLIRDAKKQMDVNKKEIDLIKTELSEIKYVLDAINPVAYATVDQVADLVDEKLEDLQRKKKG
jgi:septation ring formation regulator EzrA